MTSPAPLDAQVVRIPVAVLGIGIRSPMRSRGATARPAWQFMSPMRRAGAADFGLSIRLPCCRQASEHLCRDGRRGRRWDFRPRRSGQSFRHREFRRFRASGPGALAHPYCAACDTKRSGWHRSPPRAAYAARDDRAAIGGTGGTCHRNRARLSEISHSWPDRPGGDCGTRRRWLAPSRKQRDRSKASPMEVVARKRPSA